MAILFVNQGVERLMDFLLNGTGGGCGTNIYLFTNNHTPDVTDTVGNYTQCTSCDPDGFIQTGLWTVSVSAGVATCETGPLDFVFAPSGSPDTIYGYICSDPTQAGTPLFFVEKLDTPFVVPATGCTLRVNISWKAQMCAP